MSTTGDDWAYQRAVAAAVNAEIGGRGWTRKHLAAVSGISEQQMERILNLKRQMNVQQLGQIIDALGVTPEYLAAEVNTWRRRQAGLPVEPITYGPQVPLSAVDLRATIRDLLAQPDSDGELSRRLVDIELRTGVKGRRLERLLAQVRQSRQEELTRALAALPPAGEGDSDAPNQHQGGQ